MQKLKQLNFLLLLCIVALISSCQKETTSTQSELDLNLSREQIKQKVEKELAKGNIFHWEKQSTELIHRAAMLSDSVISIGYTIDKDFSMEDNIHTINLEGDQWKATRLKVENIILEAERVNNSEITMRDLEPWGRVQNFPQIIIQTTNLELLKELREMDEIRFIEPIGFNISDYEAVARSSSGCSGDPDYNINTNDYTTVSPTAKVPWNFYNHNIDDAWNASSKGNNIKVCIIDSGASYDQDNLGSKFNSGNSNNRTVHKYSTKYSGKWWWKSKDSPDDPCGHGTSMAGHAAAPWSNDGNSVGVAYQSNLMTIRGVEDVIISTSNERNGVRDALYLAGNSSAKVISMSIGSPFSSNTVADGIYYAYNHNKLIFAAAGTSLSWTSWYPVIFPATMSQTRAVTGVTDNNNLEKCATCHSGSQVDFVIIMERDNDDDRNSLSLATYSNQPKYVGGSSSATATTAGIATMVWAENPSASRTQVLNALKNASSIYPSRHNNFGWGLIDAAQAVNNL